MDDTDLRYAELLEAVSHDLRNPLGTLVMAAQTLQAAFPADDPRAQRVQQIADRIQRQTGKLARLADVVADFAATRGRALPLVRTTCAPTALVEAVVAGMQILAAERELVVTGSVAADADAIECEQARVVQIGEAFAQVALKAAPKGSPILVAARPGGVLALTATLPGLDASIFEPSWRPHSPGYKSAPILFGLMRGLVESHGGAIHAALAPDDAVTVTLTFVRP